LDRVGRVGQSLEIFGYNGIAIAGLMGIHPGNRSTNALLAGDLVAWTDSIRIGRK
jgi:hypothetical protein